MYLLDTNVVSELRKVASGKADKNVIAWSQQVNADLLFISSIVLHELELGILLAERNDPKKGSILRRWMVECVLPSFEKRILVVDKEVALLSATFHVPKPKPYRDTLIAASAMVNKMTVVTRNVADFNLTGLKVFNPWD